MKLSPANPKTATFLLVLCKLSRAQVCDDNKCTLASCMVPAVNATLLECSDGWVGRLANENATRYTCCPEGYDGLSLEVLEQCSTKTCTSPDGKGGMDCSADGFIHPMVCDETSIYKHPRKEPSATIYSPYACCITSTAQDEGLLVASSIWTILSGMTFVACSLLILGILKSPKARGQGFNLYLVFLATPDALFNLFSLARNIINIKGDQLSKQLGGLVHALEWFHTAANFALNGVVVFQVYTMLTNARRFQKTQPPSVKMVCLQSFAVFIYSAVWSGWSLVLLLQGSNIFDNTNAAWLTSKALMVGPPFVYVFLTCTRVWWQGLLPSKGRTRVLSLYFFRVVYVFFLTWVPFLILVDVTYYKTGSLWMLGLAYYFSSIQGLLSVMVALTKPDVKRAVTNLVCCRGDNFTESEATFLGSQGKNVGKSLIGTWSSKFRPSTGVSERFSSSRFASGRDENNAEDANSAQFDVSPLSHSTEDGIRRQSSTSMTGRVSERDTEDAYNATLTIPRNNEPDEETIRD